MSDLQYGVIGLGHIGRRLVAGIRAAGARTHAFDVAEAAVAAAGEVEPTTSPADLASKVDVVYIAVLDAIQAREVIAGEAGLLETARPGTIVIVTSTIDLTSVRELAEVCHERGVVFADVGVTTLPGSEDDMAKSIVSMVGTEPCAEDKVRAAVEIVSHETVMCGDVGAGMATKIARNVITYGSWTVAAAASRLLAGTGVSDDGLREAITAADPTGRTMWLLEQEIGLDEDTRARRERISGLIEKDLGAAIELAQTVGESADLPEFVRRKRGEVLGLDARPPKPPLPGEDRYQYGAAWMDIVYGPGFHDAGVSRDGSPYNEETVAHLFADIWSRPGLSLRDRRLLVMGATAQLGRGDLIETQVYGGLHNGEFSETELREVQLQLTAYIGWGKASAVNRGINNAVARWKQSVPPA